MNQAASTRADDWKTVAEVAELLGVSERQARRYAGRLAGHDRQEAGHDAGHTAARVRVSAMRDLRENATKKSQTPDIAAPEAGRHAGHEAGHQSDAPDITPDARVLAAENEMLRESLQRERENADQWRSQVEAANRDAAELRAALREALRAMPKAIEAREYSQPVEIAQGFDSATKSAPTNKVSSGAKIAQQRAPRSLWRLILGLR